MCFTVRAAMECHWHLIVPMWSIKWKQKKQSCIIPTEIFGFEITISQCYSEKHYTFGLSKYCLVKYWTSQMNSSTHIFENSNLGYSNPISFNVKLFSTFCTKHGWVKGCYVVHSWYDEVYSRFSHLDFWRLWNKMIGVSIFFPSSTKN